MADCAGASVTFEGDQMRVRFERFGPEPYRLFLKCKALPESVTEFHPEGETYSIVAPARFAPMLGVEVPASTAPELPAAGHLFDDQREILRLALDAKRFACWSDCGLGKTALGLEWARQVSHRTSGGRVLIVTLNEVVRGWQAEAARFYPFGPCVAQLKSRQQMRDWCAGRVDLGTPVAVTNYEKWNPESLEAQVVSEARHLAGVVLDESSRLKTGGGKQKWAIIKSCRGIEYKLSLTATPAPNDVMEFASQASFLEKMRSEGEILWTYFRRDEKTHRWTVKRHAREAFFRFMASWSIYVRDPKRYGWRLDHAEVPAPEVFVHEIAATAEQLQALVELSADPDGQLDMFQSRDTNAIQRARLSQVAKGFRYLRGEAGRFDRIDSGKPAFVADLIRREAGAGLQVLVWTVFDAESSLLEDALGMASLKFGGEVPYDLLTGKTPERQRLHVLDRFARGESRCLISRAAVLGWGMNFQHCGSMIFSGWNDSYEAYYQAIRRAYRHGQTRRVRVHIPVVRELEGDMLDNIYRKQDTHEAAIAEMEANYLGARRPV